MNNSRFKLNLIITLVLSGLLPVTGSTLLGLFPIDRYWVNEPFHSVFEALGSFMALSLAILILLLQKNRRISHYYAWVSCALIGMGLLDVFHALSPPGDYFVWMHSMSILVGGFLFAMVWLPHRITQSQSARALSALVAVVAIIFGVSAAAFPDTIPLMINEGIFTTAANAINVVSGLLFLLAALYFVIRYRSYHSIEDFLFSNFCLLNGWAGLLFPLSQLWYIDWWFWHLIRLMAYFTVISYIFVTFQRNEQLQQEINERKHVEEKLSRAYDDLETRVVERTSQLAKANEALLESEASYRELAESIGEVFYAMDRDLRYTYWNSASEDLTGICAKDAVGKSLIELFPELKKARAEKLYKEVLRTQQPQRFVHRYRAGDKDLFFEINAYPSKFGLSVIAKDITERKHAEEALRGSEIRYRTLFDRSTDGVLIIDPETGATIEFNEAAHRQLGYTREEFKQIRILDYETIEKPEEMKARIEKILREGKDDFETRHRTKDGRIRDVIVTVQTIKLFDRTFLYSIFRDITERKRAEERIHEQASLLDRAHDAILVRDLEHRITYWNKGAQRLYGWTADETTGKKADERLYKEGSLMLIEAKKRVIEEGEWIGELCHVTKNGKKIIVESRWTLVHNSKGEPKSILVINTDITEKKKLEAQFLRAQRLESVGTLAGGIAHDINNILTPMMLSLQLLQDKFTDNESRNLLNILERSTQRGASLVKHVLSFARGVEGERAALQVSHIISEITQIARETFPKSIEVRTDIQKDLWTISADATQLHQVIMNLCVNARDAMPEGGTLSTSAENIFIDENCARINIDARVGQYVVITVSDTGTGIPPGILDRIFEPFFTTKQPGKGTGLGLSTVITIVKSHGGFINVYSEIGRGTVFKVYLPVIKTSEAQKVDEQLELPAGHGESILVVDDEAMVREITSSILETHGYRVLTANDGVEAIRVYTQNREKIKVILMDMMMPVMDGQACIRALHKINPDTRIIAVSGLAEKGKLAKVAVAHVKAFLPKPYVAKKLLKTIHEVISAQ